MPTPILMPALSPTMEEGTLARWAVKEGDKVAAGDVIAEIETDKATMEVEAVDEGVVGKLLAAEGAEGVKVNAPIAWLLGEGESAADIPSGDGSRSAPTEPAEQAAPPTTANAAAAAPASAANDGGDRIFASPLARRMAHQAGLDLNDLKGSGSGPHGRIVKADIVQAQTSPPNRASAAPVTAAPVAAAAPSAPGAAPAPHVEEGGYRAVKLDGMRRTIARRMTQSFQEVPHFPLTIDCELDKLLALRAELNAQSPEGDGAYKVSVNDFLIRASALALQQTPDANASYTDDALIYHAHSDVAVAVAIEGGLITPVIRKAETKGLAAISREMKDLAARARDRKLTPEEYQGGTFSISNLGMFGIQSFNSIINQPQGMILSVGAGEKRPVVCDDALAIRMMMTCTLTCDHRVVDGATGARWLAVFKRLVESPITMLL